MPPPYPVNTRRYLVEPRLYIPWGWGGSRDSPDPATGDRRESEICSSFIHTHERKLIATIGGFGPGDELWIPFVEPLLPYSSVSVCRFQKSTPFARGRGAKRRAGMGDRIERLREQPLRRQEHRRISARVYVLHVMQRDARNFGAYHVLVIPAPSPV